MVCARFSIVSMAPTYPFGDRAISDDDHGTGDGADGNSRHFVDKRNTGRPLAVVRKYGARRDRQQMARQEGRIVVTKALKKPTISDP